MKSFVLTVSCKSTRGIVAAISSYLADKGCNIIDSSQFDDLDTGRFFMRVSFISEEGLSGSAISADFAAVAAPFEMDYDFHD
ncbi:ACT domain-containing protein, partial [Rhizobium bangladeshense]